ncbi:hypothetical protein JQ628_11410 [Bradyrhizobium lablabi]|uniref:DUF6456 domain-containing protein n=1 Tax=Bradyrhizobium lablabi TaxID=722472 RepID=UPI001BAA32E6|nr:DUF6456 domain-containing protein [Bradyrhizobium lablabi]MBR1122123.1 hypothetical protein [Bradyrhizobium lablabi]
MNAQIRRRRGKPFNPAHDRRATEFNRGIGKHVQPIEVDDPMELGGRLIVMRSTRDDPLGDFHSRKHIDEAQYEGGRAFQKDFEIAERGPRAIDPSKEAVDGGRIPEPITERQRRATKRLARAHWELGVDGSALMSDFLISGRTMAQIAERRGLKGRAWDEYFGKRVRECLHCLARVYGFATEKTGKQRIQVMPENIG